MLARSTDTKRARGPNRDTPLAQPTARERARAPLTPPQALKGAIPRSFSARAVVEGTRDKIRRILRGEDSHRLLVVVGPCSIHSYEDALEYADRLRRVSRDMSDDLVIVMRTYLEKPRTCGGWKGYLNDPDLDGSCDTARGIELSRRLLLRLNEMGVPCATEFLDPLASVYLEDLVSWAAIGARTSESQTHRELASRLPMPVGFKNSTDGRIEVARQAMIVAGQQHSVFGLSPEGLPAVLQTRGNDDAHIVLRGGGGMPNCDPESVRRAVRLGSEAGLARPVLVDCSHENSGYDPERQAPTARRVLDQIDRGQSGVAGLMLESHLRPGSQPWSGNGGAEPGISLTDPCLGWEETRDLLREISEGRRQRRSRV